MRRSAATACSSVQSSTTSCSIRPSSASCGDGNQATRRCIWGPSGHRRRLVPPLKRISIQSYRAVRDLEFEPRSMCALVGEASSGKSTVLTAIWTLLEAAAPPTTIDDVSSHGTGGRIHLEADVERGRSIFLDARPPDTLNLNRAGSPPVLFLPANLRSRTLVAPATGRGAAEVAELFQPPA